MKNFTNYLQSHPRLTEWFMLMIYPSVIMALVVYSIM